MKKTPHQQFAENLRKQVKHNRDHCRRPLRACSSDQADSEDDELSEEELQRLLEQKFDELFGTTDGNDEEE